MSATLTLTLDTAPPASPALSINGGAVVTATDVVDLAITTPSPDVQEMRIWGDLDPTADARFQGTEDLSAWTLYSPAVVVRLSAGSGVKQVYVRLRDDVLNETPVFADQITLDIDAIVASIVTPPDRSRISTVSPCNVATFAWQANKPFDHWEIRVVPGSASLHSAGLPLLTADGSFDADTPLTAMILGNTLQAASPGDSTKTIKVFVRGLDGGWSS